MGDRWAAVVSVALVIELVAGSATLVVRSRTAAEDRREATEVAFSPRPSSPAWTPEPSADPSPATPAVDVVATQSSAPVPPSAAPAASAAAQAPPATAAAQPAPRQAPPQAPPAPAPAPPPPPPETRMRAAAAETESERIFREQFPAQAAARQVDGDRASLHWAVIVGVNDYAGRTKDTIGSRADAILLRQLLLQRGWRDDHILLLTDRAGTHDNIVRGLEWLARSTDERSVVVFSFSGHMKYMNGDPDADGEARDSGLWPADNRFIWDSDMARMLNAIRAARMWVSYQGCHSGGMNDPGMERAGRLITYSSLQKQKSYEDPEVGHSVQGWFMFAEGIRDGRGDSDGDGRVSVQEAYAWNAPRAHARTSQRQTPQLADGLGRPFFLDVA